MITALQRLEERASPNQYLSHIHTEVSLKQALERCNQRLKLDMEGLAYYEIKLEELENNVRNGIIEKQYILEAIGKLK